MGEGQVSAGEGHPMTVSEKLRVVVAVLLGVFGVVILAGVCIQALEGTSKYSLVTDLLLTILLLTLLTSYSIELYKLIRQALTRRTLEDSKKIVLQLAKKRRGTLTVAEVAANSALTLEQAKETLDRLNIQGFNEMDVSNAGIIVDKFHL
jgi:hypothetical protein